MKSAYFPLVPDMFSFCEALSHRKDGALPSIFRAAETEEADSR